MKHMNVFKSIRGSKALSTAVGFIVLGAVLLTIGVLAVVSESKSDKQFAEIDGVISSITVEREYAGTDDFNEIYTVLVDYTVNGVTYKGVEYGAYSSGMHEQDTVKVLYNVDDPGEIRAPGSEKVPYVFIAAGVIALGISAVMILKEKRM